jgi:hypothetical protein
MKARVKETGEIFDIECVSLRLTGKVLSSFGINDVEVLMPDLTPDYWTLLEHTYAGMAMQGLMTILPNIGGLEGRTPKDEIVDIAIETAHALVEKMKEKRK